MTVLVAGFDSTTALMLRQNSFMIEEIEVDGDFELTDWINAQNITYEAVLINLDKGAGLYVCRESREAGTLTPVIGVRSIDRDESWSEVRSVFLEQGGDDLLRGPANPREMAASLRACARRLKGGATSIHKYRCGANELVINQTMGAVFINEHRVHMTGRQYAMISALADSAGRILSKESLMMRIYSPGADDEPEIKIIDVFICKIRAALNEVAPGSGAIIDTVWGRGYRLTTDLTQQQERAA